MKHPAKELVNVRDRTWICPIRETCMDSRDGQSVVTDQKDWSSFLEQRHHKLSYLFKRITLTHTILLCPLTVSDQRRVIPGGSCSSA